MKKVFMLKDGTIIEEEEVKSVYMANDGTIHQFARDCHEYDYAEFMRTHPHPFMRIIILDQDIRFQGGRQVKEIFFQDFKDAFDRGLCMKCFITSADEARKFYETLSDNPMKDILPLRDGEGCFIAFEEYQYYDFEEECNKFVPEWAFQAIVDSDFDEWLRYGKGKGQFIPLLHRYRYYEDEIEGMRQRQIEREIVEEYLDYL